MKYIVSSCLLGIKCRYNGKTQKNKNIYKLFEKGLVTPVCPEILGGLLTPRAPSEIVIKEGKKNVLTINGNDVTKNFYKGAHITLTIAKSVGATKAILKSNSPSCGKYKVYDGSFSGILIQGEGITAKVLRENGICIINEHEWSLKEQN